MSLMKKWPLSVLAAGGGGRLSSMVEQQLLVMVYGKYRCIKVSSRALTKGLRHLG
jgi:hypothetical protein